MKIDISQLKGVIGKLSVLRSYSSFILPAILIVIALFLLSIPAPLMSSRLKRQINNDSLSKGKQINSFNLDEISQKQVELERQYQDVYAKDASEISGLLRQTTERELLSYKLFPEPSDKSILIFHDFGNRYRAALEGLVKEVGGRESPTSTELEMNLQKSNPSGDSFGSVRFSDDFMIDTFSFSGRSEVEQTIVDELCLSVARSGSCYVNVFNLPGYNYWNTSSGQESGTYQRYTYVDPNQSVSECWYWQVGYWIIEDVFKTIEAVNSNCSSILDCPVKRLMSIDFGKQTSEGSRGSAGIESGRFGRSNNTSPIYVQSGKGGLTRSFTKRISSERIDVVHFRISVVVNADNVLSFMKELCSSKEHVFRGWSGQESPRTYKRNQITILDSNMEPINLDSNEHNLYRYGQDAVFRLDLTCEYIFDKSAYSQVKPGFIEDLKTKK